VLGFADRVAVLVRGAVRASGRPAEVRDQLSAAYLGEVAS
jgi:ABC-type branched-subunit amino acid transport system ATPase component